MVTITLVSMHEKRERGLLVPLHFSVLCTLVALCRIGEGGQFAVNSMTTWKGRGEFALSGAAFRVGRGQFVMYYVAVLMRGGAAVLV